MASQKYSQRKAPQKLRHGLTLILKHTVKEVVPHIDTDREIVPKKRLNLNLLLKHNEIKLYHQEDLAENSNS